MLHGNTGRKQSGTWFWVLLVMSELKAATAVTDSDLPSRMMRMFHSV